jgi:hypothetical protein
MNKPRWSLVTGADFARSFRWARTAPRLRDFMKPEDELRIVEAKMAAIPGEPCGGFACHCSNPLHGVWHQLSIRRDELRAQTIEVRPVGESRRRLREIARLARESAAAQRKLADGLMHRVRELEHDNAALRAHLDRILDPKVKPNLTKSHGQPE